MPSTFTPRIREILLILAEHDRFLTSARERLPRQFAAAGLARCRALLDAMCSLDEAGRADVVGVLARALLETWLVATYVLLRGDRESLQEIGAAHAKAARIMGARLALGEGFTVRVEEWTEAVEGRKDMPSYEELAKRVKTLLEPQGENLDVTLMYDMLYRAQSTFDAHGGVGSIGRYIAYDPKDEFDGLIPNPGPPFERQDVMAATLVCLLAKLVFKEFGVIVEKLDGAWEAFAREAVA